jgi:hypothetical protein
VATIRGRWAARRGRVAVARGAGCEPPHQGQGRDGIGGGHGRGPGDRLGRGGGEARGGRGPGAPGARGLAEARTVAAADRPGEDPDDRDPDGDQPRRPEVRRAGGGRPADRRRLGHRADAGVAGHPGADGRGGRPAGRPGAAAGLLPLRRRASSHQPGARGVSDPPPGVVRRTGLARGRGPALDASRGRPRGPAADRGVRRAVSAGGPPPGGSER